MFQLNNMLCCFYLNLDRKCSIVCRVYEIEKSVLEFLQGNFSPHLQYIKLLDKNIKR